MAYTPNTKYPQEAWRFMEYLVGPQGQEAIAKIGWNIPGRQGNRVQPYFRRNPNLNAEITQTFLKAAERTELFHRSPYINPAEYNLLFNPEWELVMLGEKSVPEALADAARKIKPSHSRQHGSTEGQGR